METPCDHLLPRRNMIVFNLVRPGVNCIPTKATSGSAGFDLRADLTEALVIPGNSSAIIPTGISTSFDKSVVGMICSRSGMAAKHRVFVLNSPGIIDSDYTDEIKVILMNVGGKDFVVEPYQRIAQIVFTYVAYPFIDEANVAVRTGGFGSTGSK